MKMNEIGAAGPIAISLINLVPDDFDRRKPGTAAAQSASRQPPVKQFKNCIAACNQSSGSQAGTKPDVRFRCAALGSKAGGASVLAFATWRLFVGSNGETAWSIIPGISPGTS
jgi:hypothetical protein